MPMTLDDFRILIDTHGGHPASWPEHLRPPALELIDTNDEARAALAALLKAEDGLRSEKPSQAPTGLVSRILDKLPPKSGTS